MRYSQLGARLAILKKPSIVCPSLPSCPSAHLFSTSRVQAYAPGKPNDLTRRPRRLRWLRGIKDREEAGLHVDACRCVWEVAVDKVAKRLVRHIHFDVSHANMVFLQSQSQSAHEQSASPIAAAATYSAICATVLLIDKQHSHKASTTRASSHCGSVREKMAPHSDVRFAALLSLLPGPLVPLLLPTECRCS